MSFLEKLFDKKVDRSQAVVQAIRKLRETEEMLIKKQEYLESKIEREILIAKKNASINKSTAIQALKRKRRYEHQLQKIDGTLTTIEMQREALERVNTNTTVLKTIKNAAEALKSANANLDVDKVYDLLDDIADQNDLVNEISNAISSPVGFSEEVDEEELEKELEDLEEESLEQNLLEVPFTHEMPTPKHVKTKTSKSKQDDEEIEKLAEWAS